MLQSFSYLLGAVAFEVLWTVLLKGSKGFGALWSGIALFVAYVLSLVFLDLACKTLDVSLAYAVWSGASAALVAVMGIWLFAEPLHAARIVGLVLVISGVVVLAGLEPQKAGV
jgi:multidrug transporter EmrE-like cation transporter